MFRKIPVRCQKCGRQTQIDWCPDVVTPSIAELDGATVSAYLQEILDAEGHEPRARIQTEQPTEVNYCPFCTKKRKRGMQPEEGDTFALPKHKKRGKELQAQSLELPGYSAELGDDEQCSSTQAIDNALTVAVKGNTRRGPSLYGQELLDREGVGQAHSLAGNPVAIRHAQEFLEGKTGPEIQKELGLSKWEARSRSRLPALEQKALEQKARPPRKKRARSTLHKCPHGVWLVAGKPKGCSVCSVKKVSVGR